MRLLLIALLAVTVGCRAASKLEKKPIPEIEAVRFENLNLKYVAVQKEMNDLQNQFRELAARTCKVTVDLPVEKCVIDWQAKTAGPAPEPPKVAAPPNGTTVKPIEKK